MGNKQATGLGEDSGDEERGEEDSGEDDKEEERLDEDGPGLKLAGLLASKSGFGLAFGLCFGTETGTRRVTFRTWTVAFDGFVVVEPDFGTTPTTPLPPEEELLNRSFGELKKSISV